MASKYKTKSYSDKLRKISYDAGVKKKKSKGKPATSELKTTKKGGAGRQTYRKGGKAKYR